MAFQIAQYYSVLAIRTFIRSIPGADRGGRLGGR
jgi:hypothetical protein